MIKLFVENTNLHSPVAAVRWCVDKNDINKLKDLGVKKPFMLFVVAREDDDVFREVDKKVVPLDQAMEYIEFRSPGRHKIFGCLVWGGSKNELEQYANRSRLVISDGNFDRPHIYTHYELEYGSVDVVVPKGYFAKEPAAWEKWWVNLWHESTPVNQCHFRRRRFLAYSLQPPVVLAYILCRMSLSIVHILALLLCGTRKIKYKAIWHPFIYNRYDAAPKKLSSVFLENSSGVKRHPLYFLSVPLVQLVILGLLGLVNWGLHKLGLSVGSILLWLLAINVVVVLAEIVVSMLGGLDKLFPQETEEQRLARKKLELERLYAEYQDIVCVGAPLRPDISSLPSKRRTVYLRFKEFQSNVCLPFAK